MRKMILAVMAVAAGLSVAGCSDAMLGRAVGRGSSAKYKDHRKADADLTCAELKTDLSDVDSDLGAVQTKLTVYGTNSDNARDAATLREQRDAYQKRRGEIDAHYQAKQCAAERQ